MSYLPGVLLQMAAPASTAPQASQDHSMLSVVFSSDPVVKSVLILLILFSVSSWAIIFYKYIQLKRAKRLSNKFLQTFDNSYSIEEVLTKAQAEEGNPLYKVFTSGISDILRFRQMKAKDPSHQAILNLNHIQKKIRRAQSDETHRLELLTPFLATTASTAPFIGLFGTVWGILGAFWKIGKMGSAGLAVVGPYIAEALIATAVGLAAAIPAVVAYNYFITRIKNLSKELDNFSGDFEQRIEREYF